VTGTKPLQIHGRLRMERLVKDDGEHSMNG
jgi:hypothetical protein